MRKILFTKHFLRQYKKYKKRFPALEREIEEAFRMLIEDPFQPTLQTHKLHGKLSARLSCSCGYDCRILFSIEKTGDVEEIVLIEIGTHDEMY